MACACHSLAAWQRLMPSSLAAVISLSNNDVISLRSLRSFRSLRWLETPLYLKQASLRTLYNERFTNLLIDWLIVWLIESYVTAYCRQKDPRRLQVDNLRLRRRPRPGGYSARLCMHTDDPRTLYAEPQSVCDKLY